MLKPKIPTTAKSTKPNAWVAKVPGQPSPSANPEPSEREKGLQELLHRLHTRIFAPEHVEEAALVVTQVMTRADALRLAQKYLTSPIAQVQQFARHLLRIIETPAKPYAPSETGAPNPGYSAIAEVIKQWIREESGRKSR